MAPRSTIDADSAFRKPLPETAALIKGEKLVRYAVIAAGAGASTGASMNMNIKQC
jgi:hypothetical protein